MKGDFFLKEQGVISKWSTWHGQCICNPCVQWLYVLTSRFCGWDPKQKKEKPLVVSRRRDEVQTRWEASGIKTRYPHANVEAMNSRRIGSRRTGSVKQVSVEERWQHAAFFFLLILMNTTKTFFLFSFFWTCLPTEPPTPPAPPESDFSGEEKSLIYHATWSEQRVTKHQVWHYYSLLQMLQ